MSSFNGAVSRGSPSPSVAAAIARVSLRQLTTRPSEPWAFAKAAEPRAVRDEMPVAATAGPTTCLRSTLRAMASDHAAQRDLAIVVDRIRPMAEALLRELDHQWCRGAPHDAVAAARSRLVDHTVVGLFHLARSWAGIRTAVAPLSVIAVGGYGESLLPPGVPPELLLLVPESERVRGEAERMAAQLVDALRAIGFAPVPSTRTARECLALAYDEPPLLASLSSARHLAGAFGIWVRLRTGVDELRWS
jgi:UTP:GlnB (protein PII) uridylyltransferase